MKTLQINTVEEDAMDGNTIMLKLYTAQGERLYEWPVSQREVQHGSDNRSGKLADYFWRVLLNLVFGPVRRRT